MGFKCSYFGVGPCVECTLEEASHAFGEIVAQPLVSDGELDDDGDFFEQIVRGAGVAHAVDVLTAHLLDQAMANAPSRIHLSMTRW